MTQFRGGYCGKVGCTDNLDCPEASACMAHDDGKNYCFRVCKDKVECNENRSVELESNCSSNITFVDKEIEGKACVPPSGEDNTEGDTTKDENPDDTTLSADAGSSESDNEKDKYNPYIRLGAIPVSSTTTIKSTGEPLQTEMSGWVKVLTWTAHP